VQREASEPFSSQSTTTAVNRAGRSTKGGPRLIVRPGIAKGQFAACKLDLNLERNSMRLRSTCVSGLIAFSVLSNSLGSMRAADDPLPSWNDGPAKQAIVDFVGMVTTNGSADFIAPANRVAVFDNDGTLWPENPVPFQLAFALDRLKQDLPSRPAWNEDPFVKAAVSGDTATLLADHYKGLFRILALTHAGMTTSEFDARVNEWVATAKHPRFGRPYVDCVYQPMLEVLAYLRTGGFRTYIVSGGGADFMRVWSEPVYGIPPEQVVGSYGQVRFELRGDKPVLVKTLDHVFVDDKEGKPVGIHQFIARRPVMCFGNSDGDKAMLQYTTLGNPHPSFGLIVHHTDAGREYAYDAKPTSSGKLVEALAEAPQRGWTVVSMKADWNRVFPDVRIGAPASDRK